MSFLTSWASIIYYAFVLANMALTFYVYLIFEKALRQFEVDADLYDHKLLSENGDPALRIFPEIKLTEEQEQEEQKRDTDIEADQ